MKIKALKVSETFSSSQLKDLLQIEMNLEGTTKSGMHSRIVKRKYIKQRILQQLWLIPKDNVDLTKEDETRRRYFVMKKTLRKKLSVETLALPGTARRKGTHEPTTVLIEKNWREKFKLSTRLFKAVLKRFKPKIKLILYKRSQIDAKYG